MRSFREMQATHGRLIKSGLREPTSLWNNILKEYFNCERPQLACQVFVDMSQKDASSWNIITAGLARCGRIDDARRLFDENPTRSTVSWNCMMSAYNSDGHHVDVLKLFACMHQEVFSRSSFSFATVLNACANLPVQRFSKQVHADATRIGLVSNHIVASALIRVYSAHNMLGDACQAFQEARYRDGVLWTSIISAHAQNEDGVAALYLFQMMEKAGETPNQLTFASIIDTCGSLAALKQGSQTHARVLKLGYGQNLMIATALVNMYSKCGRWNEASQVFGSIREPDIIMWNAVIWGAALNGQTAIAVDQFKRMSETNLVPNHSTFSGILLACTHANLLDEAMSFYKRMTETYGLHPQPDHCASMISLLGRYGQLDEAVNLMQSAPFEPSRAMWGALLGACVIHHNLEWGKRAAEYLFLMEPLNSTPYVQLANIYASAGMWAEAAEIRKEMKSKGIKKVPGCSWIYIRSETVFFTAGDRSHAKSPEIYKKLRLVNGEMKAIGYVPHRGLVFQHVDDEDEKEEILSQHSEMLALALGLLELSSELPLWIVNNQRMCTNCHTAFQFISKISNRKITVRDTSRFHNFEHGSCSCRNFW
ncbi:unnamed protein product [Victoria cruziana]